LKWRRRRRRRRKGHFGISVLTQKSGLNKYKSKRKF
jgi:hypothetical protein